ncbi:MAG: hypothetical protein ACI9IP_000838 [Arcticibacterium sp.]|jgi:uncharacterized protein (TIGR00369 family)
MDNLNEQFFGTLSKMSGDKMMFPPPFMEGMGMEVLEHIQGESVKISIPVKPIYNNPLGTTFGGYYGVFFDMAFGPFSSLAAKAPTSTLDLNIWFIKSLSPADERVLIEAKVVNLSKNYLLLSAEAKNLSGELVAIATSRTLILDVSRMKSLT